MTSSRGPLLALDTASEIASLAVHDGRRVLVEVAWLAGREHSTRLLPEVEHALGLAGLAPADLGGLAVARGPGSFTGVRVALSLAKGLAAALDLPIWGADTLDILAHAAGADRPAVRPAVHLGRGRLATARYELGHRREEIRTVAGAELAGLWRPDEVLLGDLPDELPAGAVALSPAVGLRRAAVLAELAWQALERGDPGDAAALDAVYLASRGQPG